MACPATATASTTRRTSPPFGPRWSKPASHRPRSRRLPVGTRCECCRPCCRLPEAVLAVLDVGESSRDHAGARDDDGFPGGCPMCDHLKFSAFDSAKTHDMWDDLAEMRDRCPV